MIDLLQNQFAEALANAFLHSLWQGAVVVVVLKLLSSTGILETARSKYMAYFLGLCTIFVSCAVGVFLSLNTHAPTWEYMDQVLAYESINLVTQKAVPIFTVRDLGLIVWIVGVVVIGSKHTIELFKLYRIRNTSHNSLITIFT